MSCRDDGENKDDGDERDRNAACYKPFLFCLPIIALLFYGLAVPPAGAEGRMVTVGVYENAPKIFTDESGKPAGIFIDIIDKRLFRCL
ncbi:MAG: hypothetical protein WA081_11520 [Desulfosalsimonadaceae bacterium]